MVAVLVVVAVVLGAVVVAVVLDVVVDAAAVRMGQQMPVLTHHRPPPAMLSMLLCRNHSLRWWRIDLHLHQIPTTNK